MFCPNCGTQVSDTAKFCGACGASLQNAVPAQNEAEASTAPAEVSSQASNNATDDTGKQPQLDRKKLAIIVAIIAAVALIAAALVIFAQAKNDQDKHAARYLQVVVHADNFANDATPIPLIVKGTDVDGNAVETTAYMKDPKLDGSLITSNIEVGLGSYEISFPASPLSPSGVFYTPPSEVIKAEINSDLKPGGICLATSDTPPSLVLANLTDVTPEQIATAANYAKESGFDEGLINQYLATTNQVRDAAIAEAEQRAREEEEARRQAELRAQYHIVTDYYEFDLPEYWRGKVTWEADDKGKVTVRSSEYPDCRLISFSVVPTSNPLNLGDIGGGCSFYKDGSKGKRVELWKDNWGYLIGEECRTTTGTGKELTERQEALIKLITGGVLYTRADLASHSRSSDMAFHDYIQKAIVPNIVVY